MQDIAEHVDKRKEQIKDLKERTVQAKSDKVELYRDISTFECNYSARNRREIFFLIEDLTEKIDTQMEEIHQASTKEEGIRSWLTQEQLSDIHRDFCSVRALQRDGYKRHEGNNWCLVEEGMEEQRAKAIVAGFGHAMTL